MNDDPSGFGETKVLVPEPRATDFGSLLRSAREAMGISAGELAGRLRLHVKQIEALERCDLAALPGLIYVRAFLRSCARELRIEAAPLIADLEKRAGVSGASEFASAARPFRMSAFGDSSRPLIVILLAGLVIAGLIGTFWPRREAILPKAPEAAAAPVQPAPDTKASGDSPAPSATPAQAAPSPPMPAPAAAPVAAPQASPAPRVDRSAAPASAGASATAFSTARAEKSADPIFSPVAATDESQSTDRAETAAAPAVPLVLRVREAAWIEVVQANGTTLLSRVCEAGSVQTIRGMPPLRVVIGNSAAVQAEFRGNAVDLPHYATTNGVARLTLE